MVTIINDEPTSIFTWRNYVAFGLQENMAVDSQGLGSKVWPAEDLGLTDIKQKD